MILKTNLKPFSIQKCIQDRINREAYLFEKDIVQPKPKPFKSPLKKSVGLYNLFKNNVESFIREFRP